MRHFIIFALPLIISGCHFVPDTAENDSTLKLEMAYSAPLLKMVYSAPLFEEKIDFLSISEDGSKFVAGSERDGVGLYNANDYLPIERYYESDKSQILSTPTAYIRGVGFFDTNTWYFAANPNREQDTERITNIHIRTIQPQTEIKQYSFPNGQILLNKNHFAIFRGALKEQFNSESILVNWRTGAIYSFNIPANIFESGFGWVVIYDNSITLTESSRILAQDIHDKTYHWFLLDPVTQEDRQMLKNYVFFSPDEHYGVDMGESRCKLREFSSRKIVPLQKQKIVGFCSEPFFKKDDKNRLITFSPDGKFFAVAFDREVRIYQVEPFKLVFRPKMFSHAGALTLTNDGLLATSDSRGYLRVWNYKTGQLIGQHHFSNPNDTSNSEIYFKPLLIFHPDGKRLFFTSYDILRVFQLPERETE